MIILIKWISIQTHFNSWPLRTVDHSWSQVLSQHNLYLIISLVPTETWPAPSITPTCSSLSDLTLSLYSTAPLTHTHTSARVNFHIALFFFPPAESSWEISNIPSQSAAAPHRPAKTTRSRIPAFQQKKNRWANRVGVKNPGSTGDLYENPMHRCKRWITTIIIK